jgi:hypothetical protein
MQELKSILQKSGDTEAKNEKRFDELSVIAFWQGFN